MSMKVCPDEKFKRLRDYYYYICDRSVINRDVYEAYLTLELI